MKLLDPVHGACWVFRGDKDDLFRFTNVAPATERAAQNSLEKLFSEDDSNAAAEDADSQDVESCDASDAHECLKRLTVNGDRQCLLKH